MNRLAAAALAALLASPARAAAAPAARVTGTVLKTEIDANPADGGGSLVIVDKAGRASEYTVRHASRITRDGKEIGFDATLVGDLVVRAKFDPKTKTLTVLDLKSSGTAKPAPAAAPSGVVDGEVAMADALKGVLSVRTGPGSTREFKIVDATKVLREGAEGKPSLEIEFESVKVGDAVEVRSRDGKTADELRVRAAAK